MTNCELKQKIKQNGFALWQVAEQIGVCDLTLSRWLRSERDTRNQPKIIKALEELKAEQGAAVNG